VTIAGFTVTGGTFGIAINRGATGTIDRNTVRNAAIGGLEVSHNSFARIINNTVERNQRHGIFVLGSASAHIGVVSTDDQTPRPNVVKDNAADGIQVLRAFTARIIGNTISGNGRNGLTIQQASHADVAGNTFDGNGRTRFAWPQFWRESGGLRHALVYSPEHHDKTKRSVRHPVRDRCVYRWSDRRPGGEDGRQGRVGQKMRRSLGQVRHGPRGRFVGNGLEFARRSNRRGLARASRQVEGKDSW
jgi:parallel beta-helix repeat protein